MAALQPGITRSRSAAEWHILGHTYWKVSDSTDSFSFETVDPPGTFVPPHIHPDQDEYIYVLEGTLDLMLGGEDQTANAGDCVCMPRGIPHAYYNNSDAPARCLFWVTPSGTLSSLFDLLHELSDPDEVVRLSAQHGVNFLPPPE